MKSTSCAIHGESCKHPCDIHSDGTKGVHRCERCRTYSYLTGNAYRYDDEEKEVYEIQAWLISIDQDPGWDILPRKPLPKFRS